MAGAYRERLGGWMVRVVGPWREDAVFGGRRGLPRFGLVPTLAWCLESTCHRRVTRSTALHAKAYCPASSDHVKSTTYGLRQYSVRSRLHSNDGYQISFVCNCVLARAVV